MGKSSSSSKKLKRSKEDPSKLRSVKKKKKTKRSKSKKIRRIRDSSDESESDSSFYTSSSEDDYRREKRRSKVSKKKKKRSKKSYSSSSESDDDDDISHLKRKKRSKRKDQRVVTKKKNKRRRRDLSSSSSSSDDDGSESDGKRVSREKGRAKDWSEEPDEGWQVEDDVVTEKNSKRLKSIVVVTYNYDDGGERKEDDKSDENMVVDDQRDGEATLSSPVTGAHDNRSIGYDDFEEYDSSETSKASLPDNSLKGDDLEAILKKRALENLKRFRGETLRNETVSKEVSSVSEGETVHTESEKFEESQERLLLEQELCVSAGDKDPETPQKTLEVVNAKESGTGLTDLPFQQDQQSGDTAKVKTGPGISSCTTKRKLIRPVLGKESVNLASRKEADGCQEAEAENINDKSCPESSLALGTKNGGENMEPRKVTSTSSSLAETETLGDNKEESQSEQKTNDETKGESQYEQKTMTVMRGGELVQVSYKVYIPKKTSSLGRRQLRR